MEKILRILLNILKRNKRRCLNIDCDIYIQVMYLDMGRTDGNINKVIEVVNDVPVILYGHFKKQYTSRVNDVFEVTKHGDYMYTRLIKRALYIIRKNFKNIVLKGGGIERRTIMYHQPISYRGKKMILETAILLTSSLAKFKDEENKAVSEAYRKDIEDGVIKINKPVICIETVITAIRFADERRIAYTDLKCTELINQREVKLNKKEFDRLNKEMIQNKSMMSYGMRKFQNII